MQQVSDLQLAVDALAAKKPVYDLFWNYADGDQPLVYSSEKLREIFSGLTARFTENWCAVVVGSVLDRLDLEAPAVPDNDQTTGLLQELWEVSGMVDDVHALHEDVVVTGEGFVFVWPDPATGLIAAYWNDARLCHAEYDPDDPRRVRFAVKWWKTAAGMVRLNLYYADRTELYVTRRSYQPGERPDHRAFEAYTDEGGPVVDNPYGRLPVFHFRSSRRRAMSQLAGVIEVQDMVNKLISDMMVAAEFGAYPQRYVISGAGIGDLKNNPNVIWDLVASEAGTQATSAGQFAAASLNNYLEAINKLTADIGIITRTPKHYFFAQAGDLSGEALIALESPLIKKVQRVQAALLPVWRDLAAFLLLVAGAPVETRAVSVQYAQAATVQPRTTAEIRKLSVDAGMPLRTVLRDLEGWTEEDLAQLDADQQDDQTKQAAYADAVLTQAQRNFDQGAVQ